MLDKNEAPEGYEAVECTGHDSCFDCCFFNKRLEVCGNAATHCGAYERKDRTHVYFIPKKPESKSYECWAYIWRNGSVCADSKFKSEKNVWISMVGKNEHYINAAKARGDRVVKVKITEI